MSVDKFGRHSSQAIKTKLTLTQSGDFNIENKRLCNVKNPTETQDASTKAYVDDNCLTLERGVYNTNNKRITNVSLPKSTKDVATKQFVQMELVSLVVKINDIEEKLKKLVGNV